MYAIIESGGKQYRVKKGDVIDVELLTTQEGNSVKFKNVLFLQDEKGTKVGTPYVEESAVAGELLGTEKGPKLISFKYKQRKGVRRKVGHRQRYSRVKITEIQYGT